MGDTLTPGFGRRSTEDYLLLHCSAPIIAATVSVASFGSGRLMTKISSGIEPALEYLAAVHAHAVAETKFHRSFK
jgi:hypothetical protein